MAKQEVPSSTIDLINLLQSGKDFSYRQGGGGNPAIGKAENALSGLGDSELADPLLQAIQRLGLVNNSLSNSRYSPGYSKTGNEALTQQSNMLFDYIQNAKKDGEAKQQALLSQTKAARAGSNAGGGMGGGSVGMFQPRPPNVQTGGPLVNRQEEEEEDPYKDVREEALKNALDYLKRVGISRAMM